MKQKPSKKLNLNKKTIVSFDKMRIIKAGNETCQIPCGNWTLCECQTEYTCPVPTEGCWNTDLGNTCHAPCDTIAYCETQQ
jgi:hypothetical protein